MKGTKDHALMEIIHDDLASDYFFDLIFYHAPFVGLFISSYYSFLHIPNTPSTLPRNYQFNRKYKHIHR